MKSCSFRLWRPAPAIVGAFLFTVSLLASVLTAAEPAPAPAPASAAPPAGRLRGTFEGVECEYSPGQEKLAELLAHRFAEHNARVAAEAAKPKPPLPIEPLSPADMRERRAEYLGRITAQLGLKQPTALQEECYDEFVRNYALTMEMFEAMRAFFSRSQKVSGFTLWSRDELKRRLRAGEKIAGMSYDPAADEIKAEFAFSTTDTNEKLSALAKARANLHAEYRMSFEQSGGERTYRGSVATKAPGAAPATPTPAKAEPVAEKTAPVVIPVVIPSSLADQPVEVVAEKIWSDGKPGVQEILNWIVQMPDQLPRVDPQIAFVVLHETTEIGIVDRYMRAPDRRWFCDGVANYVPWRVVRDLHGQAAANSVYNLGEQLAKHAAFREQADLRKWPAVEKQTAEEQHTPLDNARYAFAAHAIFLMTARAGDDVLPRLFAEIGKTDPKKVSIKNVEKAWKKLSGGKLDDLLADAGKIPASATPAAASSGQK